MAINCSAANLSFLSFNSPLSQGPLTISVWFKKTVTETSNLFVMYSGDVRVALVTADDGRVILLEFDTASSTAGSTTTYALNSWNHVCGVIASSTSRTIYLNGGGSFTNTGLRSATGMTSARVGSSHLGSGGGGSLNGDVAELAIWNAALTQSEVSTLSKGIMSDRVRNENLIFYSPLIRNLQDVKGALPITNNNGATVSIHPRIYT
jgi:hypothetical protein